MGLIRQFADGGTAEGRAHPRRQVRQGTIRITRRAAHSVTPSASLSGHVSGANQCHESDRKLCQDRLSNHDFKADGRLPSAPVGTEMSAGAFPFGPAVR
jgi:hypothetical protein